MCLSGSLGLCVHRIQGYPFPGNFCSLQVSPCPVPYPSLAPLMVPSQHPLLSPAIFLTCPSHTLSVRSDTSQGFEEAPTGARPVNQGWTGGVRAPAAGIAPGPAEPKERYRTVSPRLARLIRCSRRSPSRKVKAGKVNGPAAPPMRSP